MNYALKQALSRAGLNVVDVAARCEVDPKTVSRWLGGRVPHARHRARVSALLGVREPDLWPDAGRCKQRGTLGPEIQAIYPHRWMVPQEVWRMFFASAEREIGVLVYSGLFLVEDAAILRIWADKAAAGVRVRLLLGDPDSEYVTTRGDEEGIDEAMAARIRNAFVLLLPLASAWGIEIRKHSTTLYNSIFRSDTEFLLNTHVYGHPATCSPVVHLRWSDETAMASTYEASFERVWEEAVVGVRHEGGIARRFDHG
ncbi:helix-turn-helix domain-containing protein [Streptantibioticus ferralitis]|uniref:Helix-turn-helix transcriptional regulator n=1 Tax=Streptantibioticus ferralitis TaxID=236510 RepID=A0ABT5YZW2_9ACTN|nr:helix-turn-helix transcriptional regulator [Streptantibioticus ferralitis]MDF2257138.1 helix-turn-helix transcriptional regulator [Streptantibioticus ferralitis]